MAEQPPPGFVGIDENELNLELEEHGGVGASLSRNRQAAHRVYETKCNKSIGMISPCYQLHHHTVINDPGNSRLMPSAIHNKTVDIRGPGDLDLLAVPVIKSTSTFHQFKLTRVDENSVFSELPYPEPPVIQEFACFVIATYRQREPLRSEELADQEVSLKSSLLNLPARAAAAAAAGAGAGAGGGLDFPEFRQWMKDLPIFLAMFSEMNYESIFEDFHSASKASSPAGPRSLSQPPLSCLPGSFCGSSERKQASRAAGIPIYRKGFLTKKGRKLKGWKQRYYLLRGKFLFCFKRALDKVAKKSIFLPGCEVDTLTDFVMTRRYGFRITEPEGRFTPLRLYATSSAECKAWVEALKRGGAMVAVVEKYSFCETVGKGKFSVVKRAINKVNNKQVAVKVIDKKALNTKEQEFLRTELQILKVVRHPNLVHIHEITEFRDKVYIFMEYVEFGELNHYIRKRTESLPPSEIAFLAKEVANTLSYLHLCGVIHRDLKPDNILVIPDQSADRLAGLRVVDFGLSKLMKPR